MIKSLPLGIVSILCCLALGTLLVPNKPEATPPQKPISTSPAPVEIPPPPSVTESSTSSTPVEITQDTNETPEIAVTPPNPVPKPAPPKPITVVTTNNSTTAGSDITVPKPELTKKLSWGVFAGSNPTVIASFENHVEENPDYLAYFVHWGNGEGKLPTFLRDVAYERDRTLIVFWEASDYRIGGTDQPGYSYQRMLAGDWDDYFIDFNKQLAAYGGPVILIPFSELNGNWTPWSGTKNGNTPEAAVEAWRYIHGFFDETPNVKFGWAVNAASVPNTPENQIERYYPGSTYVDYVGVDGFNMGNPWMTFDQIFSQALNTISQYNKPGFIFSFASAEGPQKAAWLTDALYTQLPKYPFIEGFVYFNQNKERNWLLWSDNETLEVFNDYVSE